MTTLYDYATWIPCCPLSSAGGSGGPRPGQGVACTARTSTASVDAALACLSLGLLAALLVPRDRLGMHGVSRTLWKIYFAAAAVRYGAGAAYMRWAAQAPALEVGARLCAYVCVALCALVTQLALSHQLTFFHRGKQLRAFLQLHSPGASVCRVGQESDLTKPLAADGESSEEDKHLQQRSSSRRERRKRLVPTVTEIVIALAFLQHVAVIFVQVTSRNLAGSAWFNWVFIASLVLAHVPSFVLGANVIRRPGVVVQPRRSAKICLAVGLVTTLVMCSPAITWGWIMPTECLGRPLDFMSAFDIILLLHCVPLVCFYTFFHFEFKRHQEECISLYIVNNGSRMSFSKF
eukprot:m51a1_g12429 hypothetical protein (348) ;mRNA; r:811399-815708